jgi:sortase A
VTVHIILRSQLRSWRLLRSLQGFFLIAGFVAAGYAAYTYAALDIYQRLESWKFDRALARSSELAARAGAERSPAARPAIRIAIPRLRIRAMVSEGVDEQTLKLAVGHIPSTGLPGRPGNVGLAAHRDTLFRNLKNVREGDSITVSTLDRDYVYQVLWHKVVRPSEVAVLDPTPGEETLTLVTCYPFHFVGNAPERFIVRARRVDSLSPLL